MEYIIRAGNGRFKESFKNIQRARKHVFDIIPNFGMLKITKISNYGEEYDIGKVSRIGDDRFYYEWTGKAWKLKKDGTLGRRVE